MKNIKMLFYLLIFFLPTALLNSQTNSQPLFSISASVSTNKIPLNKTFKVTLTIKLKGNLQEYIISSPFIDKIHNMEIIGTASENTSIPTSVSNEIVSIKKYIYTLKPSSIGMAYFPKVLVSVTDKKGNLVSQLDTQSIPVEILEPIIKKNYKSVYVVTAFFIIFLLGTLIFIKYKRIKRANKNEETEEVEISIEDKYQELIKSEQEQDRLNKDRINIFVKILKGYIEEKYNIRIKNKSLKEVEEIFKDKEILGKEKILEILKDTDMIKYALEEPDSKKVKNIIDNIIEIIKAGGNNNE